MASVQVTPGEKNYIENVAIVGAGGWVGRHITKALLATGKHTVTALTRAASTAAIPAGVHRTVVVDYAQPASLVAALRGHDCLVITLSVRAPPDTSARLLQAAHDAGVRWVLPNSWGGTATNDALLRDQGVLAPRDAALAACAALGLRPVLLSLSFWYEFSLASGPRCFGFDIARRRAILFDDGARKIHVTTWPQCGRAVAAVLSLPVRLPEGGTDSSDSSSSSQLTLTALVYPNAPAIASFFVSQRDMLASLQRVTHTTDADWSVTHQSAQARFDAAQAALAAGGGTNVDGSPLTAPEAFGQRMYARIFFPDGDGYPDTLANDRLGLPREDLDEYTRVAVDMVENKTIEQYP